MKVIDILKTDKKSISFEFFPPKNFVSSLALGATIGELKSLDPAFVSVTYGAGGSTHQNTFDLVHYIQSSLNIPAMAHYTCVGATKEQLQKGLEDLKKLGIVNLMALRGDPPKGQERFETTEGGLSHGSELIALAKESGGFCIGCAGYPEKHVEAETMEKDVFYLGEKVNAGADFVVTQLFFENDFYFKYLELLKIKNISIPVIPGVMPITSYKQVDRILALSGSSLSEEFLEKLKSLKDDSEASYKLGIDFAVKQCQDLLDRGAPGIHFYTLNKSKATLEIYRRLKLDRS